MGSAALASAARLGRRAVGFEQYERGHALGSSGGRSRMIRKAYFEDAAYVPLLVRAYEGWRELEAAAGERLLFQTGVLMIGPPESEILTGARRTAQRCGLSIEELSFDDARRRYPAFALREGEVALFEPEAGYVLPEAAIEANLRVAEANGAAVHFGARVARWSALPGGAGLRVECDDGQSVDAARLAICGGPWMTSVLRELGVPLHIQRNVQHWFAPAGDGFSLGRLPSFFADRGDQPSRLYGFPDHGAGVKAAFHGYGHETTPQSLDREIHREDVEPVRRALDALLPGAAARYLGGKACMYALTPDRHFVVATHPQDERIVVAGGFSGHGFKFAPAIGEIVSSLLFEGGTQFDIEFFSPTRFARVSG